MPGPGECGSAAVGAWGAPEVGLAAAVGRSIVVAGGGVACRKAKNSATTTAESAHAQRKKIRECKFIVEWLNGAC
jgi:hypothetical protein